MTLTTTQPSIKLQEQSNTDQQLTHMEPELAKAPTNHHGRGNLQAKAKVAKVKAPTSASNGKSGENARKVNHASSVTTGSMEKTQNTPATLVATPKEAKAEKVEEKAKPGDTALTARERLTTKRHATPKEESCKDTHRNNA